MSDTPAHEALSLNLNESAIGPSPRVLQAIGDALPLLPRYVRPEQLQTLQARIAALEGVAPEQVLVGDILEPLGRWLAAEALRDGSGGEFVHSVPGYEALIEATQAFGGRALGVPLDAGLRNDLPALAAAIGPATRAVYLANPHNPSGTVDPREALDAFVRRAATRCLVVIDEVYLDYCEDREARSLVRLLREGVPLLLFRSFDKLHGLAGLAIGYALAPPALAARLRAAGIGHPHGLNQLALAAARASLDDEAHAQAVRREAAQERALWLDWLRQRGLRHAESHANFVFFDSGRPHAQLLAALQARGIRLARAFPPYEQWLRPTLGRPADNQRLRAALDELLSPSG